MSERLFVAIYEDGDVDFVLAEDEDDAYEILSRVFAEQGMEVPSCRIVPVPDKNHPSVLR